MPGSQRRRVDEAAEEMGTEFDLAIVGGGIVGLATALALRDRFPRLRLAILEKEGRVGAHQSSHNSGVIHAGIYYRPGSHKARLCAEGARLLVEFCEAHGVRYDRCGKVILATSPEELPRLQALFERGVANGVPGLEQIGPERLREIEPHARAIAALWSPATATVDFGEVCRVLARRLVEQGVEIRTGARVERCRAGAWGGMLLETTAGEVRARYAVNCAGLHADLLARRMGLRPAVRIVPFRGEYYLLRAERNLVRGLIYPVPDPAFPFLGVHFTRRVTGEVEAGPNAVLAFAREGYRRGDVHPAELLDMIAFPGFWRMAARYWRTGSAEFYRSLSRRAFVRSLQRLVPEVRARDLQPDGSGVRAQAVSPSGELLDDFEIAQTDRAIHVLHSPSPAATASLAIGRHIASLADTAWDLA